MVMLIRRDDLGNDSFGWLILCEKSENYTFWSLEILAWSCQKIEINIIFSFYILFHKRVHVALKMPWEFGKLLRFTILYSYREVVLDPK